MRTMFWCMVLAGSAVFAFGAEGEPAAPPATVKTGLVFEAEDFQQRRYVGLAVSPAVINLVARVAGEIQEVTFQDGATVEKDEVLYRIDPVQYEAAVKTAEAEIARCKAELEYAKSAYNRSLSLYAKSAASKDTMENNLRTLRVAEASLLSAEATLITAKDNLKNTAIAAPITGTIGVTNFSVGNYVSLDSGMLAKIIQTDPLRVRFAVSNRDFLSMFGSPEQFRQNASIRLRLADDSIYPEEGSIELVNNEANKNTDTLQVFARFHNPDRKLVAGSTVTVTLSDRRAQKLPAVLPSAVLYDKESAFVYVVDAENRVDKRRIVPGNARADLLFIRSGLKAGETVVTDGTHKISHGDLVSPSLAR